MKHRFNSLFFGLSGVLLAVASAGAQAPFSSTSPPNPFNRFPSTTAPAQPNSSLLAGQYPGATPGSAVQGMAANSNGVVDANHRLTRQDRLNYRVAEDRDDKVVPLIVQDSGEVEVPLIGRVKAAGKTTAELSTDIKAKLESEYYYHATVSLGLDQVAAHSNGRVYITGELSGKGALDLPADGQLTVSQAILQMGGPTIDSDLKRVHVIRKGAGKKGIIEVNVKAVLAGQADKDLVLQPGDTVDVHKKFIGIDF